MPITVVRPDSGFLKSNVRVIGIDDSPFTREDKDCVLVGVLMRLDFYVEGFVSSKIKVDGADSEESMIEIIHSKLGKNADIVMTNGITFGGFNLIDPERVASITGKPVITVTKKLPDLETMKTAIEKHLADREKIAVLERMTPELLELKNGKTLYCNYSGISLNDTKLILAKTIKQGAIPEPLRMAHLIGRFLKFGSSS